jgi:hypothetical protein
MAVSVCFDNVQNTVHYALGDVCTASAKRQALGTKDAAEALD